MTAITKRLGAVLLALTVLTAAMTGAVAADYTAPPSVDTSGTDDTSTTTELQSGDTIANFTGNETKSTTIQWLSDANDTKVDLARNGSTHVAYVNTTPTTVVWNSTDADGHFNATFSHDQLLDVQHKPGENVTMDYTLVNNTSVSSPSSAIQQWYTEWTNATATETVTDPEVASGSIVSVENKSGWLTFDTDRSTVTLENAAAPNKTFYIAAGNSSVAADFGAVISDTSGDKVSKLVLSTGPKAFVKVSTDDTKTFAPVYTKGNVPSDAPDTYAVMQSVGGTNGMAIHLGPDYAGASSVDIKAAAGDGFPLAIFTWSGYLTQAAMSFLPGMIAGGAAALAAPLFVAGRRRDREV